MLYLIYRIIGNGYNQKFYITYDEKGFYKITIMQTGKCLTVYNENIKEGEKIVQHTYQELDSQKWILRDSKVNGWVICSFVNPSLVITINDNNKLILGKNQKTNMQLFYIYNITKEQKTKTEGIYKIALGQEPSKAIGVAESNSIFNLSKYRK